MPKPEDERKPEGESGEDTTFDAFDDDEITTAYGDFPGTTPPIDGGMEQLREMHVNGADKIIVGDQAETDESAEDGDQPNLFDAEQAQLEPVAATREPEHHAHRERSVYEDTVGSSEVSEEDRVRLAALSSEGDSNVKILPGVGEIPPTNRELVERSLMEASGISDEEAERSPKRENESHAAYVRRLTREAAEGVGGTLSPGIHETSEPQQVDHDEEIILAEKRPTSNDIRGSRERHPSQGNVPPRVEED